MGNSFTGAASTSSAGRRISCSLVFGLAFPNYVTLDAYKVGTSGQLSSRDATTALFVGNLRQKAGC